MTKKLTICIALTMLIIGCKKITVDFTYSPLQPKAGEVIMFTNTSSAGENWNWTFGDNATSLTKNPNKIYKKPGEYLVTLMVDSAKNQTHSKLITVYDTVPTFVSSTDSIILYHDVTFTTNIYNPFNHALTFHWTLPANCTIVSGTPTSKSITVFFTTIGSDSVKLSVTQKDIPYEIKKLITVYPTKAPSVVMRKTDKTVVRQRIINGRLEQVSQATSKDVDAIEQTTDTVVTFNGETFYASQMSTRIAHFANLHVQHMQLDAMAQKWYITTSDGLFVANIDGSNLVSIDSVATGAIHVDADRNRIYWATSEGLKAMPLIKSKYNQFTTLPELYNSLNTIDLITVNNTLQ